MSRISNRDNLNAAIRHIVNYTKGTINCVMPAQVIEYNRKTHKATVQPLVKLRYEESEGIYKYETRPIIKSVSVLRNFHGGFLIDSPLAKGDTGWLIAADRDSVTAKKRNSNIDASKNEGPQEPITNSMHDFTFGFFLPDNWCNATAPGDGNDLVISRILPSGKASLCISISDSGIINIYGDESSGKITIDTSKLVGRDIAFREQKRIVGFDNGKFITKKSIVLASDDYDDDEIDISEYITKIHNSLSS